MRAKAFMLRSIRSALSLGLAASAGIAGWKIYSDVSAAAAVPEPRAKLLVEEGDRVTVGQVIAVLDSFAVLESQVARLRARLENAEAEFGRHDRLYREHTEPISLRDRWYMQVQVAKAELRSAQAELDLATVRSPIDGQVLKIHARSGERVGPDGIAEIGATDSMYVVAEVYETDIGRVRVGQRATVASPAFPRPIHGTVERVGLKVAKQDVLHTDPAAETDARVVEVKVRLDESQPVAGLTNLEAEVLISPEGIRGPNMDAGASPQTSHVQTN
ncbi:MAG: HlyD family efflux transporter periplasmic adaptor subunit [Deltaproteobacteria bacterium]|nr:HlyD family efflux transporter periplasmic adaptor subunit [Deltaproteobacteria bacterium]